MLEYIIPVLPASKPTGIKGKGGNIYQNSAKYLQFKKQSLEAFETYKPYECLDKCEGILIIGFLPPLRSRAKDLGQVSGAIYDILVTAQVIKDDRLTNFSKSLSYYFYDKNIQGYMIAVAESKADWKKLLIDEETALEARNVF